MRRKPETRQQQADDRPTDDEIAERVRGTAGRLFVHVDGETWRDTDNGNTGTRVELESAWLADFSRR